MHERAALHSDGCASTRRIGGSRRSNAMGGRVVVWVRGGEQRATAPGLPAQGAPGAWAVVAGGAGAGRAARVGGGARGGPRPRAPPPWVGGGGGADKKARVPVPWSLHGYG